MLQARRSASRLLQRTCRRQQRRYDSDSTKPPGKSSGHQQSAGHYEPTHHAHHAEPVNESLGVSSQISPAPYPADLWQLGSRAPYHGANITPPARFLHRPRRHTAILRNLQILPLVGRIVCRRRPAASHARHQQLQSIQGEMGGEEYPAYGYD